MLESELVANLRVAKGIAAEKFDLEAVVSALIGLRDEFWLAFSRGGRVGLVSDLELIQKIASAYDAVRNLRLLGDLFFRGGELVRAPKNRGFTRLFDPLRKDQAAVAVRLIEAAIDAIRLSPHGSRRSQCLRRRMIGLG
ncbi:MAG: hypothetical protein ACRD2L_02750 [Terriglobia bacterium]